MENIYEESDFVSISCARVPYDKVKLERGFIWYGDGIPDEDLYTFLIADSEDRTAKGFATKDGDVVFDTYAYKYYMNDIQEHFVNTVNFEENFLDITYYLDDMDSTNESRVVLTKDCTTFEGFKTASIIGFFDLGSGEYPGLHVGLTGSTSETIDNIKKILADNEFDIFFEFYRVNDEAGYMNYGNLGSYFPFAPYSYDKAVLGK